MNYYDELTKYEKQVARKRYIKHRLPMLKDRRFELGQQIKELYKKKLSEDADVKRMEGYSLSAFVYALIGKRDEKLDKERQEAYEATAKYNVAVAELETIEKDIHTMEHDLGCYVNAEKNYDEALTKWMNEVSDMSLTEDEALELGGYQKSLGKIQAQKKEIKEAKIAVENATATTELILSGLQDARSWGIYDAFFGGGLFVDMVKYDRIDRIEDDITQLHLQLYKMHTELKDIKVQGHVTPVVSGDLRFVDIFFDNIFTDWATLGEIKRTKESAESLLSQLYEIAEKIKNMEEAVFEDEAKVKEQLAKALTGRKQ